MLKQQEHLKKIKNYQFNSIYYKHLELGSYPQGMTAIKKFLVLVLFTLNIYKIHH